MRSLGIDDVSVVDPHDMMAVRRALKDATAATDRLSVIVFRAPCVLLERNFKTPYAVTEKCTGCGVCATLGCKDATAATDRLSVIVFRAPCVLLERNFKTPYAVTEKCTGCGVCATLGCPAISRDPEVRTAFIDPAQCIGCGQCAQYCGFKAIVQG